ncbi:MAG: hypothetical protein IJX39_09020 [Clostridia bacterium]|nr:hypothetical protein [Clostridia bacterium]
MKKRLPALRTGAFLVFGLFLLILLLTNAQVAMDGVRQGLSLCTETLFPSLFPFLVLSELLVSRQAGEILGKVFSRPVSALFGLSGSGATALLLGMLCGFPVGTTTAVSLAERGEMSQKELQRLILFANNPSSGFLIGAVGGALFGNGGAGVALFLITWSSAALVGIFLRLVLGKVTQPEEKPHNGAKNPPSVADFTKSVSKGFFSMLQVFAFVLFFSCIAGCLTPALDAFSLPAGVSVALYGLLEMTSGISHAVTMLAPEAAFRMAAFFASFAGLSVCLQLFSVAEGQNLRLLPYLLSKTAQGGIALLLAELYLRIFKPAFTVAQSVTTMAGEIVTFAQNDLQRGWTLGVLLAVPLLIALSAIRQKKRKNPN